VSNFLKTAPSSLIA